MESLSAGENDNSLNDNNNDSYFIFNQDKRVSYQRYEEKTLEI